MSTINDKIKKNPIIGWALFLLTIAAVFMLGLVLSTIMERRTEAQFLSQKKIDIQANESRNEVFSINYPKEYETYMKTSEMDFQSRHNGNVMIDMLDRYPNLVILWAGYGFSKDYNQARGHYYAVTDIHNTLRTGGPTGPDDGPMPATCWTCKSPDVPRMMAEIGAKEFYAGKWAKHGSEIVNAIGCADCHNTKTMELQISRPALVEAFDRMGKDINKATHQEMRTLVCAQCHVEYYFNTKEPAPGIPYLTFPWDKGLKVEDMEAYYDDMGFSDWTHGLSRTPMIKAQHPGYEIFQEGIHAKRGVSCADCHMPYKSEGGVKFTDHHVQSPLNNMANSCMVCHRESENELTENVYANMDRVVSDRGILEDLLAKAHLEAKFAWDKGAAEEAMKPVLGFIRAAQWRWDFAAASHGGSFHAPVESLRIIGTGIEKAQEARLEITRVLARIGYTEEIPLPDYSTKEKAQIVVGLDMDKLTEEKAKFLKEVLPQWLEKAAERENKLPQYDLDKVKKEVMSELSR